MDDNLSSFRACLPAPMPRNELFVGGVSAAAQAKALREGVDIVVGTPGRVMDFIEQGKLPTDAIQCFVLDEAGAWVGHTTILCFCLPYAAAAAQPAPRRPPKKENASSLLSSLGGALLSWSAPARRRSP